MSVGFTNRCQADCGSAVSSNTRGIFAGGASNGASTFRNTIDYVTIASTGNASDFGDLTQPSYSLTGTSDSTTGIIAGGFNTEYAKINVIQYVTIASTGNATDFGDLTVVKNRFGAIGPMHGGIS